MSSVSPASQPAVFLSAEWRYLAFLNYEVDPAILVPHVPRGTELDERNGRVFVSMVGFRFLKTRVLGVPFPFHQNFDEVNLRFYVRRRLPGQEGWRRGTVFVRELVPRWFIATTARLLYNEPYLSCAMQHQVDHTAQEVRTEYRWRYRGRWNLLSVEAPGGEAQPIPVGSEANFITDHFWGYNRQRNGTTMEYQIEHPRWGMWPARSHGFDCDVAALYGPPFVPFLGREPSSVFVTDGAPVTVRRGQRLNAK